MPIYAFECTTCGHQFDKLQKLSDADPTVCPDCGAHTLKRQLTAPSFRLSGSGWYETDFKKDGDKKRNLTGSGDGGGAKGEAAPGKGDAAGKADSASKGEAASSAAGDKSGSPPAKSSDAKPAAATPAPAAKPKSESPPK